MKSTQATSNHTLKLRHQSLELLAIINMKVDNRCAASRMNMQHAHNYSGIHAIKNQPTHYSDSFGHTHLFTE